MYLSHSLHWILDLELRIDNVPYSCAHLYRYRAERLFSERSSKSGRSIRGTEKDYRNIVLFVEDHRNVLQLVILWQVLYVLSNVYSVRWIRNVCALFFSDNAIQSDDDKMRDDSSFLFHRYVLRRVNIWHTASTNLSYRDLITFY